MRKTGSSLLWFAAFGIVVLLLAAPRTYAQCGATYTCVTSFTLSTSDLVSGSQQYAVGSITIVRQPGSTGAVPVGISGTDSAQVICQDGNTPSGRGCYVPQNSTSFIVYATGIVSSTVSGTLIAGAQYNPDPGISVPFNRLPFQISVLITPSRLVYGNSEKATGRVQLNVPLRGNGSVFIGVSPSGVVAPSPAYVNVSNTDTGTFDVIPSATTIVQTATVTATMGASGSTQVTVMPKKLENCDCLGMGGHPINFTNGNVFIQETDYSLPGIGGIALTRTWNSLWWNIAPSDDLAGMFGHSWRSTYEERIATINGSHKQYMRADGTAWFFLWDSVNATWILASPPNEVASLTYDSGTALYTIALHDGSKRIFNSAGYLNQIVDRNGNITQLTLDAANRATQVTDPAGRWLKFNYYDSTHRQVRTIEDATGIIATYDISVGASNAILNKVTYADSSFITFTYDGAARITQVKDKNGKVLEAHTYESTSRRGLTSERANSAEKISITYPSPTVTRVTDSLGNVTDYAYTWNQGRGFVTGITGSGCVTCGGRGNSSYTYNPETGDRLTSTDALGRTTTFSYDSDHNLLSKSISVNGSNLTWSYTYNGFGEVLTATDPLNHTITNTYDAHGNLLTTTTPAPDGNTPASVTTFGYDNKGELTSITDPLNHTTTIAYTPAGLVQSITDAQSNVTSYEYDARGNRTAVVDAQQHRTTFTYDLRNRLTKITYPDLTTTQFAYDSRGRRTSVTDQNAKVTTYAYDDADRLTSVTDAQTPTAGVTQYAYDSENNLTSITDALGRVTSFQYDSFGRVTRTTFPSTLYETYTYDAMGNLLSKTDRKSQTINYFTMRSTA